MLIKKSEKELDNMCERLKFLGETEFCKSEQLALLITAVVLMYVRHFALRHTGLCEHRKSGGGQRACPGVDWLSQGPESTLSSSLGLRGGLAATK